MTHFNKIISFFFIVFLFACTQNKNDNTEFVNDNLTSINYEDTNYANIDVKDTITKSGWKINYLVKNDESKYNDIYIQCSKNNQKVVYYGEYLIQLRLGFIPEYIGENSFYLFFWFRCATDCQGLLVMNKNGKPSFSKYENVYEYDTSLGHILYSSEECYSFDENKYMLAFKDINKNKDYKIIFNHICTAVNRGSCIDSVIFNEKQFTIRTSLKKRIDSEDYIIETKTIEL